MYLLKFDVPKLLGNATQGCNSSVQSVSLESIFSQYTDVFAEELGLLKGIEASIQVDPSAVPKFHRHRSVPFALKRR